MLDNILYCYCCLIFSIFSNNICTNTSLPLLFSLRARVLGCDNSQMQHVDVLLDDFHDNF